MEGLTGPKRFEGSALLFPFKRDSKNALKTEGDSFHGKGKLEKTKEVHICIYIYAKIIGKIAQGIKRLEWYLYNIY